MKKKNEIIETEAEEGPRDEFEKALDEFGEITENSGVIINGRIYRFLEPTETVRQPTEFVGKVDRFVDEDFVGRNFGSGRYKIRYVIKGDGRPTVDKTFIFSVGKEYDKYVIQKPSSEPPRVPDAQGAQNARGGSILSFLDNISAEKITACIAAVEALKRVFMPKPAPAPNWEKLVEVLAANRPAQTVSDAIVLKAMDTMNAPKPSASITEHLKELKAIKEALKDEEREEEEEEEEEEKDGDEMNLILKTALKYLPILLQKNNGNYQAVGQEAAQNPVISELVKNDPDVARAFLDSVKDKYGIDAAHKIAAGFNYEYSPEESGAEAGANV